MIFSEGSGVGDSIYGNWQAPIRMFLESQEQAYEQESVLLQIYGEQESKHWAESYTGLTGFGTFEPVGENGAYPQAEVEQGYDKTIINETWKNSFAISREMVDDDTVGVFKQRPAGFMKSYSATREEFGAALLAGASAGSTAVTYKGRSFNAACADGLALFSKVHPGKVSKKTQSNLFSNALTAENLGKAETAMQNFRGDNDELLAIAPKTIVIPNIASLKKAAFEAVGSVDDPASSNNAWNYQYGRWNIIVWPYLNQFLASGAEPWFLLDKEYSDLAATLIWQNRVELEVKSVIAENDANVWKGYARFGAGFGDWRGIAVGGVTGGTAL